MKVDYISEIIYEVQHIERTRFSKAFFFCDTKYIKIHLIDYNYLSEICSISGYKSATINNSTKLLTIHSIGNLS